MAGLVPAISLREAHLSGVAGTSSVKTALRAFCPMTTSQKFPHTPTSVRLILKGPPKLKRRRGVSKDGAASCFETRCFAALLSMRAGSEGALVARMSAATCGAVHRREDPGLLIRLRSPRGGGCGDCNQ
jgi:hypothetical protein